MSFFAALLFFFAVFHLPPLRKLPALATTRDRAAVAMGVFFIGAGAFHFVRPETYMPMIPSLLPAPLFWVYASGALEIAGGAALFVRRWRRWAGIGLTCLLVAILPANIQVAIASVQIEELPFPRWYFWIRIPFQACYVVWALWAGGPLFRRDSLSHDTARGKAASRTRSDGRLGGG